MILASIAITLLSGTAQAGHEKGNGGGAWVCREHDAAQSVRWARLVDLFEAEYGDDPLHLERSSATPTELQLQASVERLRLASPSFAQALDASMAVVRQHWPKRPGASELVRVDDSLYTRIPDRRHCAGGTIEYGQVVNFIDNPRIGAIAIQIDGNLLSALETETDRAALVLHEAVYHLLRRTEQAKDSRKARRIVGYAFSNAAPETFRSLLETTSAPETVTLPITAIPSFDVMDLPQGTRFLLKQSVVVQPGFYAVEIAKGKPRYYDKKITFDFGNPVDCVVWMRESAQAARILKQGLELVVTGSKFMKDDDEYLFTVSSETVAGISCNARLLTHELQRRLQNLFDIRVPVTEEVNR